jgi:hypothetical protein
VLRLPLTVIINIKSNVSSENGTQGLTNLAYIRNPQHNHLTIVACLALFLFALGTVAVAVHDKAHSRVTLPAHSFHPTTTTATIAPSIPQATTPTPKPTPINGQEGQKVGPNDIYHRLGPRQFFFSFFFSFTN